MNELGDRIPIPPKDSMNTGLSPAKESTMLMKLGKPGKLTDDCSDPVDVIRGCRCPLS